VPKHTCGPAAAALDRGLDNLAAVRRRGFAVDEEEDAEGVICVDAAFFGHDGGLRGSGQRDRHQGDLPAWRVEERGQAVRRCADRVSESLGGSRYAEIST
jgi:IclR family transcriptional regulator, acetate operon repressor